MGVLDRSSELLSGLLGLGLRTGLERAGQRVGGFESQKPAILGHTLIHRGGMESTSGSLLHGAARQTLRVAHGTRVE